MKKYRILSLIMTIMMVLSLFAGCGDSGADKDEVEVSDNISVSAESGDLGEDEAEDSAQSIEPEVEKVKLTVLWGQSWYDAGVEELINEAMAEKYPEIEIEWECVDWETEFYGKMEEYMATELPDIIIGKPQDVTKYQAQGVIGAIDSTYTERAVEGVLEHVTLDGTVYGMPINVIYHGIFYNKELFAERWLELPETMRYLYGVDIERPESDVVLFASHMADNSGVMNITMQGLMNEEFLYTPDWGERFRAGKESFINGLGVQYAYMYNQLIVYNNTFADVLSVDEKTCDERFVNGEAVMKISGSWSVRSFLEIDPDFEFGFFAFPNQKGDHKLIYEPDITIMTNKNPAQPEAVNAFMELVTGDKELLVKIYDFTLSDSLIVGVEPTFINPCQADIDAYIAEGKVIDATICNTQLAWDTFQKENVKDIVAWLKEEGTFKDCLVNSDARVGESGIN